MALALGEDLESYSPAYLKDLVPFLRILKKIHFF